ncbi:MAG: PAS domain-containing methyl-accepting chemotaxis protein [Rhodospirillaceae bacterium]|nr:PAS domain-containing methyl-accepting chemotaxis protein [Rhodospirillales bacterium]
MSLFNKKNKELEDKLDALNKSQAIIEFQMDGRVITANSNFLKALGFEASEVEGKHHSMFVEPAYRDSQEYKQFWDKLNRGEFQAAQYKRIGKGGKEVWIEASYNPIIGANGKPYRVIKYATDVTSQNQAFADLQAQVNAIKKSQAVIEFTLDGTILTANENFLSALGYRLDEIQGKHHSMFVEPAERDGAAYREFWQKLKRGEYQSAQYKRIGKGGRVVWIEASYNPILDLNGKPFKVVKYATDVTKQIELLSSLKQLIDQNFSEIDSAIDQSGKQAQSANEAAAETSSNVQMVASAAEELAASVGEISQSMTKSQAATDSAFNQVVSAGQSTQRLNDAASAMGGIVGLITNIAGQINLLALNATIESARAGDAGKGFAVVANEVKNLANQAAKATEQISKEIEGVQSISGEVVSALDIIRGSIGEVREFVSATASAVEEQSAVTRDMSANMQNASAAVATISQNIGEISAAVHQAESAVSKTKEAAQVLAR